MRTRLVALALLSGAFAPVCAQESAPLELFSRADKGHCIACHRLPAGAGPATRSDLGPELTGARMRELGKAALREVIADPTVANPSTVMPPYGRHRILQTSEIARLVDFLHALP